LAQGGRSPCRYPAKRARILAPTATIQNAQKFMDVFCSHIEGPASDIDRGAVITFAAHL